MKDMLHKYVGFVFCSVKCRNLFIIAMKKSDEYEKKEIMERDVVI